MSRNEKSEIAARRPARPPTHPGAILREDVLPAIGEAVADAAKKLGVTRQHLHRILAEKAPISPGLPAASPKVPQPLPTGRCQRR